LAQSARVNSADVDPFAVIIFSGVALLVLAVWLVGRFYPGSGLEQVGLRSARQIVETREALEAEDLDQMLAAHNERRRARGETEVTAADLELRVARDVREQERRREAYLNQRDLDELLAATNARRRARGLSERTPEEARREFGTDSGGGSSDPPLDS
jgi:glyoxylase-like metal-dependent hydrolase (beta-lactamase superfamily II)